MTRFHQWLEGQDIMKTCPQSIFIEDGCKQLQAIQMALALAGEMSADIHELKPYKARGPQWCHVSDAPTAGASAVAMFTWDLIAA